MRDWRQRKGRHTVVPLCGRPSWCSQLRALWNAQRWAVDGAGREVDMSERSRRVCTCGHIAGGGNGNSGGDGSVVGVVLVVLRSEDGGGEKSVTKGGSFTNAILYSLLARGGGLRELKSCSRHSVATSSGTNDYEFCRRGEACSGW